MLSRTTEYALRAAIYLAKAGAENVTAQVIAEATKVPEGYLSKVLNTLARARIVSSQRGPSGGFALTIPPTELTMLRVVEAVEPLPRIKACPLNIAEHSGELCPLHAVLAGLVDAIETTLSNTTIAQLLSEPVVPLGTESACIFPELRSDAKNRESSSPTTNPQKQTRPA